MNFAERHAAQRNRFAILTLHTEDVKDVPALERELAKLERTTWKGRRLSLPVLLDSTGRTMREWGVGALPTALLVDPQGMIVAGGHQHEAEEALEQALR
jgi:hypothetical protein